MLGTRCSLSIGWRPDHPKTCGNPRRTLQTNMAPRASPVKRRPAFASAGTSSYNRWMTRIVLLARLFVLGLSMAWLVSGCATGRGRPRGYPVQPGYPPPGQGAPVTRGAPPPFYRAAPPPVIDRRDDHDRDHHRRDKDDDRHDQGRHRGDRHDHDDRDRDRDKHHGDKGRDKHDKDDKHDKRDKNDKDDDRRGPGWKR